MSYLAALVLFGIAAHAQQPPSEGFNIFGKVVLPVAPAKGQTDFPADVKNWAGWGALKEGFTSITPPGPFLVDGDWSPVLSSPFASKPAVGAVPWRVKVFLLPSVDFLSLDSSGNKVERRSGIYGPTRERIVQGLALAAATLQAETSGRLAVTFDTTEDPALYEETTPAGAGLGAASLREYVGPRINGGSFEANDSLYHGPYHLCLVIHAGLCAPAFAEVNGTPVYGIPAPADDASVSAYAWDVLRGFEVAASGWSKQHGRRMQEFNGAIGFPPPFIEVFGSQSPDQVAADVNLGPILGSSLVETSKSGPYAGAVFSDTHPQLLSNVSPNTQLSIAEDPGKGSVLTAKIGGVFPSGGFAIPLPSVIEKVAGGDHFLVFDVRTASPDSLSVSATPIDVADDPEIVLGKRLDPGPAIPIPNDGTWHTVAIDLTVLKGNAAQDRIYLRVPRYALNYPKVSIVSTEYAFANFSLAASAPAGALSPTESNGPEWGTRIAAARTAVKAGSSPENVATVTQALADPDESVRLNTLLALAETKFPGLEEKITACMGTINPRITEAASAALAYQDSPLGWANLLQVLRVGPGTHSKVEAASFVAQRKDPASAGQISALQSASRDWHDRVTLAKALSVCGTPQAIIFLRAFLDDPDPAVRTAAVGLVPIDDDPGMNRVRFVSVNDPSDTARAAAAIKLLQSHSTDTKRDGYRGANDDSWWVRVEVLNWIAGHPSPDDRPTLRQTILSPYGQVRAAALRAFSASPDPVSLDEIANVARDEDPMVQRELIKLATAKKLALPADSIAVLKNSIAPDVVEAAKTLQGS